MLLHYYKTGLIINSLNMNENEIEGFLVENYWLINSTLKLESDK